MKPPPPAAEDVVWSVHRGPSRNLRIWTWILGLSLAVISTVIMHGLQLEPGPWWGSAIVSLVLGAIIPLSVSSGASAWITRNGQLWYGFGRHPQLHFPLSAVTTWKPVRAGMLSGLGVEIEPEDIIFVHRKGISYATMRRWKRGLSLTLVLEHLQQQDLTDITEHAARIS